MGATEIAKAVGCKRERPQDAQGGRLNLAGLEARIARRQQALLRSGAAQTIKVDRFRLGNELAPPPPFDSSASGPQRSCAA